MEWYVSALLHVSNALSLMAFLIENESGALQGFFFSLIYLIVGTPPCLAST
jgi:hypothetical protein